jgi:hypothetical protein
MKLFNYNASSETNIKWIFDLRWDFFYDIPKEYGWKLFFHFIFSINIPVGTFKWIMFSEEADSLLKWKFRFFRSFKIHIWRHYERVWWKIKIYIAFMNLFWVLEKDYECIKTGLSVDYYNDNLR